jgi:hypothetical protein
MIATISIKFAEGETIPCPGCGAAHKIEHKNLALSLGECPECEVEVIVLPEDGDTGIVQ